MNPAYLKTVFDVETPERLPSAFLIITAYNPQGRSAPPSRNQHQDLTLCSVLRSRGGDPVRIVGRSEDGAHQEPGWGVALPLADGLEIGRMFKQVAIYQVIDDELTLHICGKGSQGLKAPESLGSWRARLR